MGCETNAEAIDAGSNVDSGPPDTRSTDSGQHDSGPPESDADASWINERTFSVVPLDSVAFAGSIPNAAYLPSTGKLYLIYASTSGLVEASSEDGIEFVGLGMPTTKFDDAMATHSLAAADVLVRETSSGTRRYFINGLEAVGVEQRHVYVVDATDSGLMVSAGPVYSGALYDENGVGVPDIVEVSNGAWRMVYTAMYATPGNSHTAISYDEGLSWNPESTNPFGDYYGGNLPQTNNVDPAPLALQDGTYMAVTMRAGRLYFFNSIDALSFVEVPHFSLSIADFPTAPPEARIFMDPTIAQMPDGRIYLYVCAAGDPGGDFIVGAEITLAL